MIPTQTKINALIKKTTKNDWQWKSSEALFLQPIVISKLSKIKKDSTNLYLEYLDIQFQKTFVHLWDKETQLFYRDSTYFDKKEKNGNKQFSRLSNSGVFAGLALLISDLPKDWKKRTFYEDIFKQMAESIKNTQQKEGTWSEGLLGDKKEYKNLEIGVHIADVSHFVQPNTLVDQEAYERATSVYLPDRVNPMLPERISNELCSLRPNEDKYTFSVIFQITNRGEIKHKWIGRTITHSNHRFTYEDVQQIIESKEGLYDKALLLLNNLAKHFRKERFDNGAINFSSQEVRFTLDEDGKPIGIVIKESKDAHKLVEEFMLLANRTIAEYVSRIKSNKEPVPFPYRIHDTPDDEKLKPFAAFAKKFGYTFDIHDEAAVARSFNNLLKEVNGKPEQHVLEQLGIRTMAKAVYTSKNIGHYGLGFEHYCHFTSPIRRYPDVMVHRVLQECLDKDLKIDKKMEEKCKHCSDKERKAMEAERAGNKYKQVEFMQNYLGEEFDGIISGVASFGFFVETVLHKCEGMVTVRDLSEFDEFKLDDADYALVGMRTGKKFRMGDAVKIKVVAANLEKRQLDYHWVQEVGQPALDIAKSKGATKRKK